MSSFSSQSSKLVNAVHEHENETALLYILVTQINCNGFADLFLLSLGPSKTCTNNLKMY
jgi:hypothetical protein